MSHCNISRSELVIIGDANLHMKNTTLQNIHTFYNILDCTGLHQHMYEPTYCHGQPLVVIISIDTGTILTNVKVHAIVP